MKLTKSDKFLRRPALLWLLGWLIIVLGVGWRMVPDIVYSGGNLHHAVHWFVYGYDRVWYRDRTYTDPAPASWRWADAHYGPLQATGQTVIGMPVYSNTPKNYPYVPTVLILRKTPDRVVVYELSGGP